MRNVTNTFRCARCDQSRPLVGRRARRIRGGLQWVCAACITAEASPAILDARRLRIVLKPEPHEWHLRETQWWPRFDVIDPPGWLADTVGMDIPREWFNDIPRQLAAEGYAFDPHRAAWVRTTPKGPAP